MLLVTLTADIGAALVAFPVDGSVRKPTFDGTLRVVTEQCKYSTLAEHALNTIGKLSIKLIGLTTYTITEINLFILYYKIMYFVPVCQEWGVGK